MAPLPTLEDATNIDAWRLARVASGQEGAMQFIAAWLLILGLVIFTAATGGIATVILAILILGVLTLGTAWAAFSSLAEMDASDPAVIGLAGLFLTIIAFAIGGALAGVAVLGLTIVGVALR